MGAPWIKTRVKQAKIKAQLWRYMSGFGKLHENKVGYRVSAANARPSVTILFLLFTHPETIPDCIENMTSFSFCLPLRIHF